MGLPVEKHFQPLIDFFSKSEIASTSSRPKEIALANHHNLLTLVGMVLDVSFNSFIRCFIL